MQIRDRIIISQHLDAIAKKLPNDENVQAIRKFVDIHRGLVEINGIETEVTYCYKPQTDWVEYIVRDEVYLTGYKNIKPIRN